MMGIDTVGCYSYNRVIIYGSSASLFIFLLEGGVHLHHLSPTLYFSFKFSILSLPSFEDLPFSAPTLGEEDFIHLPAVLLLIKPYIKKLKVKFSWVTHSPSAQQLAVKGSQKKEMEGEKPMIPSTVMKLPLPPFGWQSLIWVALGKTGTRYVVKVNTKHSSKERVF